MSTLRVACLQLAARGVAESWEERVERVLAQVEEVDVNLLVLPELWATGFFAFGRYAEDAERRDDLLERLGALAARKGVTLVAGSQVEPGLHNTVAAFTPDGTLTGAYRKVHLFGHGTGEAALLHAGEEAVVRELAGLRVGLTTCYDLRFPEHYRALVDLGAEAIVTVSAWPAARAGDWTLLNRARALENACLVVACNGCGDDSGTPLAGASIVVAPDGTVLAEAGAEPAALACDVDLTTIAERRRAFPVLADRRFAVAPDPHPPQT